MARGTTSSTIAATDQAGAVNSGATTSRLMAPGARSSLPEAATAPAPTSSAPRHGDRRHHLPNQTGHRQQDDQNTGGKERPDDLGPGQVLQRWTDEDRARNRPREAQGLSIDHRVHDRQHPGDEEDAEDPRGQLGGAQSAGATHRQNHRDRAGRGKDQADEAVQEIVGSEVTDQVTQAGRAYAGSLEQGSRTFSAFVMVMELLPSFDRLGPWGRCSMSSAPHPLTVRSGMPCPAWVWRTQAQQGQL